MATAHRTASKRAARRPVNGAQTDFDLEPFGAHGEGSGTGDEGEVEAVVRKVLSDLLTEASEELQAPEGERPPTNGPSRAFARGATEDGPSETPDDTDEEIPAEVSEAVQAVMAEISPEQTQALASMFEAMGEASDGGPQEAAPAGLVGFSNAELQSLERATARGGGKEIVKWIIRWLAGPGKRYLASAIRAAKRGTKAFLAWKNSLPWPVRIAISQLSPVLVTELVMWLARQAGAAEARRAAAGVPGGPGTGGRPGPLEPGPGPGGPEDTEEAVRSILADLMMKAAEELQSDEEEEELPPDEDQPSAVGGYGTLELESAEEARAEGQRLIYPPVPIGPNHPLIRALRAVSRLYFEAVRAAKGGPQSFNRWVNQLSDFNPIKHAINALPKRTRSALISWLARQSAPAARTAAAAPGETGTADIEHVVRKVLSQALAGPQASAIA